MGFHQCPCSPGASWLKFSYHLIDEGYFAASQLRLSSFQLADILRSVFGVSCNLFVTARLSKPQIIGAVLCALPLIMQVVWPEGCLAIHPKYSMMFHDVSSC